MILRTLGLVLMLATTTFAQPVVTPNKSKRIEPTDAIMPLIDEWQAQKIVEIQQRRGDGIRWKFRGPSEYYSEASRKVFPEWRFLSLSWEEVPVEKPADDPAKKKNAFPNSVGCSLAIGPDKKIVEYQGYGNYEEFGAILAQAKIKIETPEDATAVWNAFCDIHWKHWHDQKQVKINDRLWHLGSKTIEKYHYYYQVDLDENHTVLRGKLKAVR